jgi:DNA-binding CsgD family transcriptional regulator
VTLHGEIGWHRSQRDVMNNLALALALGGYHDQAAAVLNEQDAVDVPPWLAVHVEVERLQARAWVAVAGQDLPAGRRFLREAAEVGARIGDHVGEAAVLHDLARLGHPHDAIERLTTLTTVIDGQLIQARAAHALALERRDCAGLEQVSIDFENMGARLFAAEAAADAAVAWQTSGHARRAPGAVRRALSLVEACEGATTPALQTIDVRARLTGAERDTAMLAARGHSNKEIADELGLSVRTVENRLQRTYEKLGITSRKELIAALMPS